MKLVRDGATVDDLVQLTMLKAHLARDRFRLQGGDPDGAVQGWYFAIARNVAMDHLRDRQRQRRRQPAPRGEERAGALHEVASADPSVEELRVATEEEREVVDRVREAIGRLPPGQRDVVEMHKLKGMTMAQVASRLRVREGAVRVRAHRAYRALARILGSGEDSE
jgi:RNA polymerase sigma-70 factor (ECF subfamily)